MNERYSWLNVGRNSNESGYSGWLSGSREKVTHLSGSLLGFVKDGLGITSTFAALTSETCALFQLAHAGSTLLSSSNDVAVSHSFADTYVHLSSPELLLRNWCQYKYELLSNASFLGVEVRMICNNEASIENFRSGFGEKERFTDSNVSQTPLAE